MRYLTALLALLSVDLFELSTEFFVLGLEHACGLRRTIAHIPIKAAYVDHEVDAEIRHIYRSADCTFCLGTFAIPHAIGQEFFRATS